MAKLQLSTATRVLLLLTLAVNASGQTPPAAETVAVQNESIRLHALLWRPQGRGPFPAILFNHGSGRSREELQQFGPYEQQADVVGPMFARHGYVFLYLFRRGVGLSADQDGSADDQMRRELALHGQEGRNAIQLRLLEGTEMSDALSGLAFLRRLSAVDPQRIGVIGHSFGGSLTLLLAEREPKLRAAVIFSGAGYSWDRSEPLRTRLLAATQHISMPIFFIHAANDFSLSAGKALDARLSELRKPHSLKIYPPVGHTAEEGHRFVYLDANGWEHDVFAFLDENMGR